MDGSLFYLTLVKFYQAARVGYFFPFGRWWSLWMKYSMFLDEEKSERGGDYYDYFISYGLSKET